MKRTLLAGALALLCFAAPALANTYYDGQTEVRPSVLIDPASPNGGGTGALGTLANPLHTSGGGTATPTAGAGAYAAATVGVAESTVLAGGTASKFLDLVNDSATATICINFGATATIAAGVCAAGEITLPPLWHRSWEGSFIPTDAVHAIASAASTPAAIGAK